jgi:urease accessory protein
VRQGAAVNELLVAQSLREELRELLPASPGSVVHPADPGVARLRFCKGSRGTTSLGTAFATSPVRLLTPRNHGYASWVYLSSFGGGLVDGDTLRVDVEVDPGAAALLGTQASTKVYRSPRGTSQALTARVGEEGVLVLVPDPVACFAGARYGQSIDVTLGPGASLVVLDGYTCGRSARGERWDFDRYASRTIVSRRGRERPVERAGENGVDGVTEGAPRRLMVDATVLDAAHGSIASRMGRFDAVLSLAAFGPRFATLREAMLAAPSAERAGSILAASRLGEEGQREAGDGGCIVRVAAERFETASLALRSSFAVLAGLLGDDPFARKW